MRLKANRQALKVALIYVSVSVAWILVSDKALKWLISDAELRSAISIYKGCAFVAITGVLLYFAIRSLLDRYSREAKQRLTAQAAELAVGEKLRQSEERLRLVSEASNDGVWDWNLKTDLAELSPRYWEIIGYSPREEVANLSFLKRLIHPADWPAVKQLLEEQFAGKASQFSGEFRMTTKDGVVKWIWVRGKVVERDADGMALRMVGTSSDITRRKEAETALQESKERYALTERAVNDGLWDWNILTGEDNFSARWKAILGYQDNELPNLKSTFQELLHPEDRQRVEEVTVGHLQNGQRYAVEFRLRHKDGSYRWVFSRGEAMRDEAGRPYRMVGAVTDITERKVAETALRESEEKFFKVFQSSPTPIALTTLEDGRYLDANEEFLKMMQRTRSEVIGRTSLEIGIWADPAERTAIIGNVKKLGSGRNIELSIRNAAGEIRQILWSAEIVVIGGQNCLLGTSLDITDRKLAEQKHRESEERYRQLFELESDAVILVDCETHRFVDVNQSAQRLYGYTRAEFLQMTVEAVSDERDKTHGSIGSGNQFIPLRWHRKKNGERFALEITTNVISYQGRRTELATLRDITARQRVMDMLGETTDQLLEAQHIAGLGSYVFDLTTGLWNGSEVLGGIFGLADPGKSRDVRAWLEIIHPQDRQEMRDYLAEEILKKRAPFDRIYRIIRSNDQQERWVHGLGKLVLDDQGNVLRMMGVIQDITERKRAEEQMNVQFSALTAAANAIVITDRNGKIKWVNPAFSKLTGYSAEEAVGNTARILKSGQHPPTFYANMWATILTGNAWHGEIINRRKDGQLYTEDMTITPVRGADGRIAHFVAIKQDVTEQRQLEKRFQQAQKMEAIGTLAGGIAHDFNNILAAMYGYTYLLQQDTEGNTPAQENINEILKATGRAKDLVQQILTFSRQREQKPQVIQLQTVVKEAIKFLRASLPAQIKIDMNFAADAPAVLADPTQIYQVTINLATNALHAMEGRPGHLTIGLGTFEPDAKIIQTQPEFRPIVYTQLTVTDTGHGMDAKTLERVFEPFFTTKPVGKGTGLGLAVVHGIVQSHGGVITVESEVGRGTTFHLYFPGQIKQAPTAESTECQIPKGHGEKILLLDDEPALTTTMKGLLQRLNYQVSTSNSAREVLRWYQRDASQFDLVITDLTMPEMTGIELARQLRELRPHLPVILASGFSADLNRDTLRASGIYDLLEKPISMNALAEVIQRALTSQNSVRQDGATSFTA